MKKILLITNYEGMSPFAEDFCDFFKRNNNQCHILDYGKHEFFYSKEEAHQKYFRTLNFHKLFLPIRVINDKVIFPLAFKFYLKKLDHYDVILIFYHKHFLNQFIKTFKKKSNKLVILYAGSDFYRAGTNERLRNKLLIDASDTIAFTNKGMAIAFTNFYQAYHSKYIVVMPGSKIVDHIKEISKMNVGLKSDKIRITIGYNCSVAQQHLKVLNSISPVLNEYRESIQLYFPMTYNGNASYLNQIKEYVSSLNISASYYENKLSDIEIAHIKLNSDIVINMQTSDQASASLFEYIAAGNIMIVGDWLSYTFWDDNTINYHKVSFGNLEETLNYIINNFKEEKEKSSRNISNAIKAFSWEYQCNNLLKLIE